MHNKIKIFFDTKTEKEAFELKSKFLWLFKEPSFLHILSKIQDDRPINTYFIKLPVVLASMLSAKLLIYVSSGSFNYVIFPQNNLQDVYLLKITWFWACAEIKTLVMVY